MRSRFLLAGGLLAVAGSVLYLTTRRTIPKGVAAVDNFDKEKYLGKWYEIARMDYRFERNLIHTTAEYSLNDDGSIKVLNKGFDQKSGKKKTATGKAKFVNGEHEGKLKVSFYGPFYSGYNVLAIDNDYKYALVSGDSRDYLWLLSREKTMPESIKTDYLSLAETAGYDVTALTWVEQEMSE